MDVLIYTLIWILANLVIQIDIIISQEIKIPEKVEKRTGPKLWKSTDDMK